MKPVARSALRAAGALCGLLAPWPGLGHAFAAVYSSGMNAFSRVLASDAGRVEFSPEGPASSWNALVRVENAAGAFVIMSWDLRRAPFLPLAVFTALALALPLRTRARRLWLVGLGLMILQLPSLLRLLLLLTAPPLTVVELPGWILDAIFTACTALVFPPVMAFALPLLVFLALTWRIEPEALAALRGAALPAPSPQLSKSPSRSLRNAKRRRTRR